MWLAYYTTYGIEKMIDFTIYDSATGLILRDGYCQDNDFDYQTNFGESILEGRYDTNMYYVSSGTVTNRLPSVITASSDTITADGTSTITYSSIPNPTTCNILVPNGADLITDFSVTDGTLVFSANFAGIYIINMVSFPYVDFTHTVTAS